jgi:hypothetical protein
MNEIFTTITNVTRFALTNVSTEFVLHQTLAPAIQIMYVIWPDIVCQHVQLDVLMVIVMGDAAYASQAIFSNQMADFVSQNVPMAVVWEIVQHQINVNAIQAISYHRAERVYHDVQGDVQAVNAQHLKYVHVDKDIVQQLLDVNQSVPKAV